MGFAPGSQPLFQAGNTGDEIHEKIPTVHRQVPTPDVKNQIKTDTSANCQKKGTRGQSHDGFDIISRFRNNRTKRRLRLGDELAGGRGAKRKPEWRQAESKRTEPTRWLLRAKATAFRRDATVFGS